MSEPLTAEDPAVGRSRAPLVSRTAGAEADPGRFRSRVLDREEDEVLGLGGSARAPRATAAAATAPRVVTEGRVLGRFRNTYYDFPVESDFQGDSISLRDSRCGVLAQVPRAFHDAVCVQGSGILAAGRTVSFARRDCDCAELCPRTGQKICFDALDPLRFPWGRGARGTPITPLLTVAVDDSVVPLGTALYVPEYDGLPVDEARSATHDGCFLAEDRGLAVKGEHLDVFTGYSRVTRLWNSLVPSHQGVTVVVDHPRCQRAAPASAAPSRQPAR
ncbi:MAG: hypothetical protein FJ104_03055 [Deltaproteobacteria bacterium]|nr:hypothetical protein [Deltaproteobacteria bacterium]